MSSVSASVSNRMTEQNNRVNIGLAQTTAPAGQARSSRVTKRRHEFNSWKPVLAWLRGLDYPWTSAAAVTEFTPDIEMIAPVLQYLGRKENGI